MSRPFSPKRAVDHELATRGWGLQFQAMHDDEVEGWAEAWERHFTRHMRAGVQRPNCRVRSHRHGLGEGS
jgi:hypothetical protein